MSAPGHADGAVDWAGGWRGERFTHEAFVFSDDDAVRARVVPFVEEGLSRGEPVIVVADDPVREVLTAEMGARVDELAVFSPSHDFWLGGHETLAAYQQSMQPLLAAGAPWRLVGQPTWLTEPGGEVWSRFEAVANRAFVDYPYYSLCLHDRRRLPAAAQCPDRSTHAAATAPHSRRHSPGNRTRCLRAAAGRCRRRAPCPSTAPCKSCRPGSR